MHASPQDDGIMLADLLAAFSLATDLGLGQPMEHVLRSWRIAARLSEHVELDEDERASLYYIAVLAWVGCVADTPEVARWFGDDIAFRGDSYQVELAGLPGLAFMLRHAGAGSSGLHRLRLASTLVATGGKGIERGLLSHCLTTSSMADRLGMGDQVSGPLLQFFTRWDGSGMPSGVRHDEIAASVRLFHLADVVEVVNRTDGPDAAVAVARARRGSHFDPAVVDAFCAAAAEVLDDADDPDWHDLIAADPALQRRLSGPELDAALEAVADFTDLRSTWRAGHSRGVADLAGRAAELAGLPAVDVVAVRRAGLLHDVGLHGVPATILDKPGPLTATESERMRMQAYYTERVLARPPALARLGAIAALAHERLDGSGYHRGLSGAALSAPARILAVACAYRAMTEPRAHRPALPAQRAADALRADVRAGRLAPFALDAVLAAAGGTRPRRSVGPAGLTPREVEVLVLIARGASTRQVARDLGISTKTAGTHIERIYAKTGASTRSTATLFALQNGLLVTLEQVEA
ncbi:MAG: LuxR C-terminal-related transcriptional regulator [Actinomycetales bacterium]|nr:LuxR C-terminal-related transcriptional regulator [Actinomycetales bacterium]